MAMFGDRGQGGRVISVEKKFRLHAGIYIVLPTDALSKIMYMWERLFNVTRIKGNYGTIGTQEKSCKFVALPFITSRHFNV